MQRLNSERRTVTDHLQSRSRQLNITLRLLRRHLSASGLEPHEVVVFDPIEPLNGGPTIRGEGDENVLPYHQIERRASQLTSEPRDWWPSIDDENRPLKPSPGWQNIKLLDKAVRTVGILLLGQNQNVIDRVVATFQRQQTQRQDFTPIFIIDSVYADPFLQSGFVVEMIPVPEDQALYSGSRPWQDFIMERLIGIRDKWHVTQFLEFGKTRFPIRGLAEETGEEASGEQGSGGEEQQADTRARRTNQHAAE